MEKISRGTHLDSAEVYYNAGNVREAAERAALGLGFPETPISKEEISGLTKDPVELAVVANLTRIAIDAHKTLANSSFLAPDVYKNISVAADVINSVSRNPEFQEVIKGISVDHKGREHFFAPELKRDEAKTVQAASILYPKKEGEAMFELGEEILEREYQRLPDEHPTKPLIGIEVQLSRNIRGENIDTDLIMEDFKKLRDNNMDDKGEYKNPHRIATVAAWLFGLSKKIANPQMEKEATDVYFSILKKHPGLKFIYTNEMKKIFKKGRDTMVKITTPLVSEEKREELKHRLTENI